jgi:hypothetical protein
MKSEAQMIYFIIGGITLFLIVAGFAISFLMRQQTGWKYCGRCALYYNIVGDRTNEPKWLDESESDLCPACQWENRVRRGACVKFYKP